MFEINIIVQTNGTTEVFITSDKVVYIFDSLETALDSLKNLSEVQNNL